MTAPDDHIDPNQRAPQPGRRQPPPREQGAHARESGSERRGGTGDPYEDFDGLGGSTPEDGFDFAAAWEAFGTAAAKTAAKATGPEREGRDHQCVELCPICRGAEILRAVGPPELRGQLADLQREGLLTLRALIDHYLERESARAAGAERVEEIPID